MAGQLPWGIQGYAAYLSPTLKEEYQMICPGCEVEMQGKVILKDFDILEDTSSSLDIRFTCDACGAEWWFRITPDNLMED